MFHLSARKNTKIFLKKIKFDKHSYNLYVNILTKKKKLSHYIFVYFICQISYQFGFDSTFHDLYFDVLQNRTGYIKQLNYNMKTAYLCSENIISILLKNLFNCGKSERELQFQEYISAFDFDKMIDDYFDATNLNKLENFTLVCDEILKQKAHGTRLDRIFPII